MITKEEAHKTIRKNKCLIWLFMEVFNDYGTGGSNIPSSIKLGAGELLDDLYDDLEKIEEYFTEK